MNALCPNTGRWFAMSDRKPYQSPLWIQSHSADEIVYSDRQDGTPIARVYKKDYEWYLATGYYNHWQPLPALSKYEAFLLLLNLKKQDEL